MSKQCVVVVGSGLAGLIAAVAAAEAGAEVKVLSKSPPGLGNCTAVAGGGFTLAVGGWTSEEHRQLTLEVGRGLNQTDLVEIMSQHAPGMSERLRQWGVPFTETRGSIGTAKYAPHALRRGEVITRPLVAYAQQLGVEFLPAAVATRVLVDERGASGLQWVDKRSGRHHQLSSSAVILATGGAGRAWGRTDNPPGITGDGFRLAFELGLSFCDMEFVQFYPLGVYEAGFTTWMIGLHIADLVPLTDERGSELLPSVLQELGLRDAAHANLMARDQVSTTLADQYHRGGAVYLHVEQLSPEQWQLPDLQLLSRTYPRHRLPGDAPLRVAPIQHYLCGGVVIEDRGETEIPGLWVCGELSGGVDGANRAGGNALSNCMVFGYRAGSQAATRSQRAGAAILKTDHTALQHDDKGLAPADLLRAVQAISDEYLGPLRDAAGLARAEQRLAELREQMGCWQLRKASDVALAYQAESAWTVANLVCCGAQTRTESRGTHYRADHPQKDDSHWRQTVRLRRSGDAAIQVSYSTLGS